MVPVVGKIISEDVSVIVTGFVAEMLATDPLTFVAPAAAPSMKTLVPVLKP